MSKRTLRQKQSAFACMVPILLWEIYRSGYEVTFGEAYRRKGVGWKNSLHRKRLAIDLNLFKRGKYLRKTKDWEHFGIFWEELGQRHRLPLCWGGRFKNPPDGNHFSLSHGGFK